MIYGSQLITDERAFFFFVFPCLGKFITYTHFSSSSFLRIGSYNETHMYPGRVKPNKRNASGAALCRYHSVSIHKIHVIIIPRVLGRCAIDNLNAFAIVPVTVFSYLA